jgi:hypothetical protein
VIVGSRTGWLCIGEIGAAHRGVKSGRRILFVIKDPLPYLVAQADESGPVREEQISVNRHAVDEVIDAQPGQQLSRTLDLEAPFRDGHDDGGRRPVAPVDMGVDDQFLENLCWNLRQAAAQDRTLADAQVPDGLDHVLAVGNRLLVGNHHGLEKRNVALDGCGFPEQKQGG